MRGLTGNKIVRSIIPYGATILSLSLAATLRIERACSNGDGPTQNLPSPVIYPFPEMIAQNAFSDRSNFVAAKIFLVTTPRQHFSPQQWIPRSIPVSAKR